MNIPSRSVVKTSGGADLAFAVVVLTSYFATFSSLQTASPVQISLMIGLGTAYVLLGIYGYAYCTRSNLPWLTTLYFAVQIPLGGAIVCLGRGAGFNALVLLPLAGHSVMLLRSRSMVMVNLIIDATYVLAVALYSSSMQLIWAGLPTFIAGQVFIVIFTQMAVEEEKARGEVERLASELAEANQQLRQYAMQVEELTLTKERNRMAREIHDGVGHYLTVIHMQIQAARAVLASDPARANHTLESAQNMTQEALVDIRRSVTALRSSPDDNLTLPERINRLVQNLPAIQIHGEFTLNGSPRSLPPQVELTLYRAAQEGINNACKHAHATHLWLTLDYGQPGEVILTIRDDGVGAADPTGGFGLVGLRERVLLLNGSLQINSSEGQGFSLNIRLPG